MSHDRRPGTGRLPDDEIERLAIEYRYKGCRPWDEPLKALTDFETIDRYEIETDRLKVRLDSGVKSLPHRQVTTTEYDRTQRVLTIIVDTAVYEGLAVFRPEATLTYLTEVANVMLACDEIGAIIPELRDDAFAGIGERNQHPQAAQLASAMMISLPAMVVLGRRFKPLTAGRLVHRLDALEVTAAERLALRDRWTDAAVMKLMAERSPVRVPLNFERCVLYQTMRVLEDAARRGRIRKPDAQQSRPTNGTNGFKKE